MRTMIRSAMTMIIAGGLMLASITANAGLVTFEYTGEVTEFNQRNAGTLPFTASVGDEVRAFFSFDTSVMDSDLADPTFGRYDGALDYDLFIGSTRLDTFGADLVIENERGTPPNDRFGISGGTTFLGSDPLDFSFGFLITTVNSLISPLPGPLDLVSSDQFGPALQSLDLQALNLMGDDLSRGLASRVDRDGTVFEVRFSIDSVSGPVGTVSEPSTLALLLLCAGLAFVGLREAHRSYGGVRVAPDWS